MTRKLVRARRGEDLGKKRGREEVPGGGCPHIHKGELVSLVGLLDLLPVRCVHHGAVCLPAHAAHLEHHAVLSESPRLVREQVLDLFVCVCVCACLCGGGWVCVCVGCVCAKNRAKEHNETNKLKLQDGNIRSNRRGASERNWGEREIFGRH